MQETWVQSLVWEDLTSCGATKPEHRNYWACALEPGSRTWARAPWIRAPWREATAMRRALTPTREQIAQQQRPRPANSNNEMPKQNYKEI